MDGVGNAIFMKAASARAFDAELCMAGVEDSYCSNKVEKGATFFLA